MNIYPYIYRPIQDLIKFLFLKKNFNDLLIDYLNKNQYEEIHDIGCSDGIIASALDLKKTKYYGYDIDLTNINKAKKKYRNFRNINFMYKSIDKIHIKNKRKKIFILKGVFHHVSDTMISKFLKNLSLKDEVIALDGFYHKNQNLISVILKKMDRGNYIRTYDEYKSILPGFTLTKKISYYLKYYSHLLSTKNIDKKKLNLF
jgi:hypothetical protein